jgi:hypothetical protein
MHLSTTLRGLSALLLLAGAVQADVTETFEAGNPDGWQMDFTGTINGSAIAPIAGTVQTTGGNPDGRLEFVGLQGQFEYWALQPSSGNAAWKGNFRSKGVDGVSFDVNHVGMSPFGMHFYLLLADDMGTPELFDDVLVYSQIDFATYSFAGFGAAVPAGTWANVSWSFDSSSTTIPSGWNSFSYGGTGAGNPNADWNNVIQDVDYMAIINTNPGGGFALGTIDISFDNITLSTGEIGTPFCFCDGSGNTAPCGNVGGAGRGCANGSNSMGARLIAQGNPVASNSTVVLTATGAVPGSSGLFFQGNIQLNGGNGILFGDGLRCAATGIVRLQVVSSDATGTAVSSVDLGASVAGTTHTYQYWYRDPQGSPCGSGYNTSNGLELVWQP